MYITLREARAHLQLDDFFHDDDRIIESYIRAAEDATAKRMNRPLRELVDHHSGELSPAVKEAVLLLVGHFYNQREGTTVQNVKAAPLGFEFLTDLDRISPIG